MDKQWRQQARNKFRGTGTKGSLPKEMHTWEKKQRPTLSKSATNWIKLRQVTPEFLVTIFNNSPTKVCQFPVSPYHLTQVKNTFNLSPLNFVKNFIFFFRFYSNSEMKLDFAYWVGHSLQLSSYKCMVFICYSFFRNKR